MIMRAVIIGSVKFSQTMFLELVENELLQIVGVCTRKQPLANSDLLDLTQDCVSYGIPRRYSPDINSEESIDWIRSLEPDVIFCVGWSMLISKSLLDIPSLGIIGYHPSTLPANRGRHPIIWALALGLTETGSTFFLMDEGTDSGPIVSQRKVPIFETDDASTLYTRVTCTAVSQIAEVLESLRQGVDIGTPQDETKASYWRKREESDGEIDWRMPANGIYNLVRSLTRPYVGAHFVYKGERFTVWACKKLMMPPSRDEPGKILKISPEGILVKCGLDAIILLEVQPNLQVGEGEYL